MTTRTEHLSGSHLQVATTGVHLCEHPNPVDVTAIKDRTEVRYCGACSSSWSELGTCGHSSAAGEAVAMSTSSDFRRGGVVTSPATADSPPIWLHPDECLLVRRSGRWVCLRSHHHHGHPRDQDAPR